jgi:putative spermidine/putrescine transport system permease protein
MSRGVDRDVSHWQRAWLYAYAAMVLLFLVAPILIVVPMSFTPAEHLEFPPPSLSLRWYRSFFDSAEWMDAGWVSVRAAFFTVLVATPLGTAAAYGLHVAAGPWTKILRAALVVPLIVPVIIVAIGLFYVFAKLGLINTMTGLVLAHTVLAIPFVIVTVTAGLRRYEMSQEMVARSLGANRWVAFFTVTLPQIRTSVLSGALFAFVTSFDEVVIALFISRGESSTLTRKMFTSLRDQVSPTIAAISTMLIAISILVAAAVVIQEISKPHRTARGA